MFVGLVWLTSNQVFGSDDFWDKSFSSFLKNLKLPSFYSSNFKVFKNALGQFITNRPLKHVITSTNPTIDIPPLTVLFWNSPLFCNCLLADL